MRDTTRALIGHYVDHLGLTGQVLEIGGHRQEGAPPRSSPSPLCSPSTTSALEAVGQARTRSSVTSPTVARPSPTGRSTSCCPPRRSSTSRGPGWSCRRDRPDPAAGWPRHHLHRVLRAQPATADRLLALLPGVPGVPVRRPGVPGDRLRPERATDRTSRGTGRSGLDSVPVDQLGGWREHWGVYHVGRKGSGPAVPRFKDSDHPLAGYLRMDTQGKVTNPRMRGVHPPPDTTAPARCGRSSPT